MRPAICAFCGGEWRMPYELMCLPADWPLLCAGCVEESSAYEREGSDEPQGEREHYEAAFTIKRRTP